jgi:hypothetical protein
MEGGNSLVFRAGQKDFYAVRDIYISDYINWNFPYRLLEPNDNVLELGYRIRSQIEEISQGLFDKLRATNGIRQLDFSVHISMRPEFDIHHSWLVSILEHHRMHIYFAH